MNGLSVPTEKEFYVEESTKKKLLTLTKLARTSPQNVLIKGKQGCGKSELAEQFAARLSRPYVEFQVGLLAESGQLFGQQTLKNGQVEYQTFLFTDAIQVKNCVVVLDEINRAENPKALNALFSILDDRRTLYLDEIGKTVKVAEGVIFFATINEGTEFTGIDLLDAAISDRFHVIEMGVLPMEQEIALLVARVGVEETVATQLVDVFNKARNEDLFVSTRKGIQVAFLVQEGLSVRESFEFSLGLDKDRLEKILLAIHFSREDDEASGGRTWVNL